MSFTTFNGFTSIPYTRLVPKPDATWKYGCGPAETVWIEETYLGQKLLDLAPENPILVGDIIFRHNHRLGPAVRETRSMVRAFDQRLADENKRASTANEPIVKKVRELDRQFDDLMIERVAQIQERSQALCKSIGALGVAAGELGVSFDPSTPIACFDEDVAESIELCANKLGIAYSEKEGPRFLVSLLEHFFTFITGVILGLSVGISIGVIDVSFWQAQPVQAGVFSGIGVGIVYMVGTVIKSLSRAAREAEDLQNGWEISLKRLAWAFATLCFILESVVVASGLLNQDGSGIKLITLPGGWLLSLSYLSFNLARGWLKDPIVIRNRILGSMREKRIADIKERKGRPEWKQAMVAQNAVIACKACGEAEKLAFEERSGLIGERQKVLLQSLHPIKSGWTEEERALLEYARNYAEVQQQEIDRRLREVERLTTPGAGSTRVQYRASKRIGFLAWLRTVVRWRERAREVA